MSTREVSENEMLVGVLQAAPGSCRVHFQLAGVQNSDQRCWCLIERGFRNQIVSTSKHTLLAVGRGHGFLAPPDLVRASSVSCFSVSCKISAKYK